jgi:nucleotide-binding universal stress UspA family protein
MVLLDRSEAMQLRSVAFQARRILVATDLGAASEEAIRAAVRWAESSRSEVLCCHVSRHLEPGDPRRSARSAPRSDRRAELDRTTVRDQLRSVLGRRGGDIPVHVTGGEPGPGIAAMVDALLPDLLVVGAPRGLGLKRVLLGSVAEDVVGLAHCAVLAARPATGRGGILVAADLSDDPLSALQAAGTVSRTIPGRVTVVHALSEAHRLRVGMGELASAYSNGSWNEIAHDELGAGALTGFLQNLGVEGEARIYREDPVGAFLETVEELRPEICVVAMDASGYFTYRNLGSAARILIHAGPCSVLVVRPLRASA